MPTTLKKYFLNRKTVKNKCLRFKNYIKRGRYILSVEKGALLFKKASFFQIIFNLKRSYVLQGKGKNTSFRLISGTEKINFITERIVVSQFINQDINLELIHNRIETYLPKLLLPHSDYLHFDLEKKEIITNYVSGSSFSDAIHTAKLMNMLVNRGLISEATMLGGHVKCLLFVQHGDAYGNNIIWQDDDNFVCIDNENVGLYPAFYDAFLLAAINSSNVDEFLFFNDRFTLLYENFCEKNKISFNTFFDRYLSYFIFFRMMSYPSDKRGLNHRPFSFMSDKKFKDLFPEANNVLKTLSEGKSIPYLETIYVDSGHEL